jgi:UDP-N-acetylglucosamine--N-acetylmuramyl-(pentapeptide) pyrophosphoryl-undecaprenol N-acetylglucosamine transferase
MRILIAAGGTGGHVYPALAVVRSLGDRAPEADFLWLGGRRGLESTIVPGEGLPLRLLWLRSLRTTDRSVHTILDPLRLGASYAQALAILRRRRPAAIFTTGGYLAIPVIAAAATLRVPSVIWEGNLVAGRSVRASALLASAVAVSFAETCAELGGRRPCFVTGTPIRSFAGHDRPSARRALDLDPQLPVLLVFGGSQAVRRLNRAVWDALPTLVEKCCVVHLTGQSAYADALRRREALPEKRRAHYRPFAFVRSQMTDVLLAADLLVGRAGSSTLAEASAVGLPMVVVPYPWADAHQSANARALADAGAARLVADADFDATALLDAAALLDDRATLERMRAAARGLGRPGAADAAAELVLALGERAALPTPATIERLSRAAA